MSRLILRSGALRSSISARSSLKLCPIPSLSRSASSYYSPTPSSPQRGIKIGHLFSALALLGLTATSYGLYQFYSSFTSYPPALRSHLRAALRSASTGDYPRAGKAFDAAWELAVQLEREGGENALAGMKVAAVGIRQGGMWEEMGESTKAVEAYERAFRFLAERIALREASSLPIPTRNEELKRAISLAIKLGDLFADIGGKEGMGKAEGYFVFAVEELLRGTMSGEQLEAVKIEVEHGVVSQVGTGGEKPKAGSAKGGKGEALPEWMDSVELASGLERLGEFYSKTGRPEYAQPLLLQAISILLPPPAKDGTKLPDPPIKTRCHAATLMNNLSSSLVSTAAKPSSEAINQASRWARQAISVSSQCRLEGEISRGAKVVAVLDREEGECEMVSVVGSFNLGALSELAGDPTSAIKWFERSSLHAKRLGIKDEASIALRRLRLATATPSPSR